MSPSSVCHELYSDNVVEGRRGVAQSTATQHGGQTAVLWDFLSGLSSPFRAATLGKYISIEEPSDSMNESSRFEDLIHGDHISVQEVQDAKTLATGCVGIVRIAAPDILRAPLEGGRGMPSSSKGQASRGDPGRTPPEPPPPPGRPGRGDQGGRDDEEGRGGHGGAGDPGGPGG